MTDKIVVNPKQAETVRLIFHLFLEGMTPHSIAAELTSRGIKTPAGKAAWIHYFVRSTRKGDRPFLIEPYSIARPSGLPVSHSY